MRSDVPVPELPVIGEIGPAADAIDQPFWDGLARGELLLPRCAGCDRWLWPAQWLCPHCHRFDPAWEAVPAQGRIYSWTRTWHGFASEFAAHTPYVTVVVELPQAGDRRLVGILLPDGRGDDPTIGAPVVGVIQPPGPLTSGMAVLRWRLAPHRSDNGVNEGE